MIEDGGKFRMWYTACPPSGLALLPFRICYAESDDGIHWVKPNLGLYEWEGSKANNIVMDSNIENGGGVFLDPRAPPDQRYKLLARLSSKKVMGPGEDPQVNNAPNGSGLYIYTSADGLRWTLQPTRLFPFSPDTVNLAFYDRRTGKYLAYVRTWNPLRRVGVVETGDIMQPGSMIKMRRCVLAVRDRRKIRPRLGRFRRRSDRSLAIRPTWTSTLRQRSNTPGRTTPILCFPAPTAIFPNRSRASTTMTA